MKIICAWCRRVLYYSCPECGNHLVTPQQPILRGKYMTCRGDQPQNTDNPRNVHTEMLFSFAHMGTSHGICDRCTEKMLAARSAEFAPRSAPQLLIIQEPPTPESIKQAIEAAELTDEDRGNLAAQLIAEINQALGPPKKSGVQ